MFCGRLKTPEPIIEPMTNAVNEPSRNFLLTATGSVEVTSFMPIEVMVFSQGSKILWETLDTGWRRQTLILVKTVVINCKLGHRTTRVLADDPGVRRSCNAASPAVRLADSTLRARAMQSLQALQEGTLTADDLLTRLGRGEPFGTIDLGEGLEVPASWRPLDFEQIAAQARCVEYPLKGKGGDGLSALLAQFAKRLQRTFWRATCFLGEFPSSGRFRCLSLAVFALWNGPRAVITLAPEGAAWMDKQNENTALRLFIH
jgi:hypothetical protein